MEHSFGILKPDCVRKDLVGRAFDLIRDRELEIIFSKKIILGAPDARFLYLRCKEAPFFENLIKFMTSGEVVIYLVRSLNRNCAIKTLNSVTGHTDPSQAKPNTLRSLGFDVCENIAHSTEDEKAFWSEVKYFLSKDELSNLKLEPS